MTTTETKWAERIQEWQASGRRAEELGPYKASGVIVEVSGARIAVERGFDAELLSEVVRVCARFLKLSR